MKTPTPPIDPLEQLIDKTLREQPSRRAPADLEARVLAAIERREAHSWWVKDFARWPVAARTVFVVLCIGLGRFAVEASTWLIADVDPAGIAAGLGSLVMWMKMLIIGAMSLMRTIPTGWMYAAAMVLGLMYALLFGLGAVAYRTLYANR